MRKIFTLSLIAVLIRFTAALTEPALAQETLVVAKNIDHVEQPNLLQQLWKTVDSDQAKAILATLGWSEVLGGVELLDQVNVIHFSDSGIDLSGAIQAPVSYTVCHAYIKDPSVNCNGTLTGSYRTADDPHSAKIDGLHYYIVVPKPAAFAGRCWVNGTIIVTFIKADPGARSKFNCGQTGTIAFHYGK
jgi:hypothetical protein